MFNAAENFELFFSFDLELKGRIVYIQAQSKCAYIELSKELERIELEGITVMHHITTYHSVMGCIYAGPIRL